MTPEFGPFQSLVTMKSGSFSGSPANRILAFTEQTRNKNVIRHRSDFFDLLMVEPLYDMPAGSHDPAVVMIHMLKPTRGKDKTGTFAGGKLKKYGRGGAK